jgi:uncharacterized protein (TIGR00255 family)
MDLVVEIKTVNSRYLDLNLRVPRELHSLEQQLRKEVQSHLNRGRVELHFELHPKSVNHHDLNEALVENYLAVAEKVRSLGGKGELEVSSILQLPGVFAPREAELSPAGIQKNLSEVLREALEKVITSRSNEGAALKKDFQERLESLSSLTDRIAKEAEQILDHYREKLKNRVEKLSQEQHLDENRLAQEILHYADRSDIAEEITRLRSHVAQFEEYLSGSEDEPVGRKLDFISQEMGREMNTILSKSPLPAISELGVEGKTVIEKIREQVQNVE